MINSHFPLFKSDIMSERYIIYIEKEAALRKALEIAFRDSEIKLYTMESTQSLSLMIADLRPKLIIVDQDSVGDILLSNFFQSSSIIITTASEKVSDDLNPYLYIQKPFSPIELMEKIESKLSL